jgi:hypothetical protein
MIVVVSLVVMREISVCVAVVVTVCAVVVPVTDDQIVEVAGTVVEPLVFVEWTVLIVVVVVVFVVVIVGL